MKRFFFLACSLAAFSQTVEADYKDDIGYTALQTFLGGATPDGSTIRLSLIEARLSTGGPYMPSPTTGDVLQDMNPAPDPSISSHASMVGHLIFGENGIAPMVGDTISSTNYPVHVYDADYWLSAVLKTSSPAQAPAVETQDIQNHSWVGGAANVATDETILRRYDYSIERDDFVAVVGLNNSVGQDQNLLSSAYNTINVGRSDGQHSYALTTANGAGRQRVHLVAPMSTTSEATAVISASTALMLDTAKRMGSLEGQRSETVKAVLMAGATKTNVSGYSYLVHGAGQVNVKRGHEIMSAGKQTVHALLTTIHNSKGWDSTSVDGGNANMYRVYLDQGSELSATLVWNALMTPNPSPNYDIYNISLANLDLRVHYNSSNDTSLGSLLTPATHGSGGNSTVNNVEHLWWDNRNAGYYTFVVQNQSAFLANYSLAWYAVPEPSKAGLMFIGLVFTVLRRRR